jgi:hypothetical protein
MDVEARFNEIADDLVAQNDDVELGGIVVPASHWAEWPRLAQDALSL